ncbi:MAG: hypothetical protein INH02_16080 [Gemmatimonas sp.]|uniref:hypothetical protein n=1 Tax=Gemmatimonas sp. TaxID=1962908 RepID=UPI0025B95A6A|nr:hypothetical protein [Gemmatimonas sp.]MCA2988931.1 hypothetical protein [Gemmatimonas sp.]
MGRFDATSALALAERALQQSGEFGLLAALAFYFVRPQLNFGVRYLHLSREGEINAWSEALGWRRHPAAGRHADVGTGAAHGYGIHIDRFRVAV